MRVCVTECMHVCLCMFAKVVCGFVRACMRVCVHVCEYM